jgi:prefoldin subunit 5
MDTDAEKDRRERRMRDEMDIEKELLDLKAKMTPIGTIKFLMGTLISFGATAAVIAALKNPLQGSRGITKLLMKLGIFVMACKAGDMAEKYFKDTVEDAENAFKEAKEEIKEVAKEND